jgi:hypothetical protein
MSTAQYLELLEWTGRVQHYGKRGFIPAATPSILQRLGLPTTQFRQALPQLAQQHANWVGNRRTLQERALALAKMFVKGAGAKHCHILKPIPSNTAKLTMTGSFVRFWI